MNAAKISSLTVCIRFSSYYGGWIVAGSWSSSFLVPFVIPENKRAQWVQKGIEWMVGVVWDREREEKNQ